MDIRQEADTRRRTGEARFRTEKSELRNPQSGITSRFRLQDPRVYRPLAVLSSGLLLAASFPRPSLAPLAWIALVPVLLAIRGLTARRAFFVGWTAGTAAFIFTIPWIVATIVEYGHLPLPVGVGAWILLSAYLGLFTGAWAAFARLIEPYSASLRAAGLAASWTALEYLRTHLFTGFPWMLLGYSQLPFLPLIQFAAFTGVYGVSFLVAWGNAGLASAFASTEEKWSRIAAAAPPLLAAAALSLYGAWEMGLPAPDGDALHAAIVQGNIDQSKKWNPRYQQEVFETYQRLTREAAGRLKDAPQGFRLVLWPETATPFHFGYDISRTGELRDFQAALGLPLLFGTPTVERNPGRPILHNSVILLAADGSAGPRYDKMHLVPYGEYVPLKPLFPFLEKMVTAIGDFGEGREYTVMRGAGVPLGTLICYEVIFPDQARRFVASGARVLVTVTNDAWFGRTGAPYQHFAMAAFRAVENGVPLIRAANTGISGVIDARGRVLGSGPLFEPWVHAQTVIAPKEAGTFYSRWGNLFAQASSAAALALMIAAWRRPAGGKGKKKRRLE
ncbi:MAG: apolipoprotein N-acyltransferase [Nitrospirae bacterium]|nr:apolipoprotein N-acyltransferase [Nitrospirota bacterium]